MLLLRSTCFLIALATLAGCSLLLDRNADQCASDRDCTRFAGAHCDTQVRLCIVASSANDADVHAPVTDAGSEAAIVDARGDVDAGIVADASTDDPCTGAKGCFRCAPTSDLQFGNGCTEAVCHPFDNRSRLKRLPPEGGLSPLPE